MLDGKWRINMNKYTFHKLWNRFMQLKWQYWFTFTSSKFCRSRLPSISFEFEVSDIFVQTKKLRISQTLRDLMDQYFIDWKWQISSLQKLSRLQFSLSLPLSFLLDSNTLIYTHVGVNFINVFRARFSYKFLVPSYVSAWRQKFVRKTRAKNVDEIDGRPVLYQRSPENTDNLVC